MSPGDEYNGWREVDRRRPTEWGSVTSGLAVGRAAVIQALAILQGEGDQGAVVTTEYLTPKDAAKLYDPKRPDDWWPSSLPEKFLPK